MRKELCISLFGLTIHIYRASGVSFLRGVQVLEFTRKGTGANSVLYNLFFVVNFLLIGFAVSDYSKALKEKS
jgi:hypothetical protein